MAITGEIATSALTETWQHLAAGISGAWTRREHGASAAVTTVPVPTLNVVFVDGADADLGAVAALLDEVAAARLPHCLQGRAACGPAVARLAQQRGMQEAAEIPLMVLEDFTPLNDDQPAEIEFRALLPDEAPLHAELAAAGFEAPEVYFRKLMTPDVLSTSGTSCFIGQVNGVPVTTAFSVTLGDFVGIFNVATPPSHRGHGYGAAVTVRALHDGMSKGAKWAWLQSSPAGYPIYERLGFRTLESWRCWVSPDQA